MIDEPTDDEAKELYAHFGQAFYCSSVLEHGIANAILILELLERRGGVKTRTEWEALVDKHFEDSFAKTLGKLKSQIARHHERSPVIASVIIDLERCVDEWNFLAHHFWRQCATHWYTKEGRASMVQRLEEARELFSETDSKLEAAIQPFADRYGLTPDIQRYELEPIKREAPQ
jgi:hypothetical protein